MTASGFRAFFPPAPPAPTSNASSISNATQLQHLIPNMRFLAQKLEGNPNFFANFPPPQQHPSGPHLASLPDRDSLEEDGNEVSTSSNVGSVGVSSQGFGMSGASNENDGPNHSIDHGADSGKFKYSNIQSFLN